jgi:large subunit ribosomal protein L29
MPLRSDEIRDMSDGDIHARVTELEEERFRLKFRSATEPLENPLRLRTIRRDIARLKTILRERQLAAGAREAGGGGATAGSASTRGRGQR